MSLREELKRLVSQDPQVIETLRHELAVEREQAAHKTKVQAMKETRERQLIEQQQHMDAECDRPILELTGKCQNCKSTIKVDYETKFVEGPQNIRASVKCTSCGKLNWIFLARGWVDLPLKISSTLNPTADSYFVCGKLVTPGGP